MNKRGAGLPGMLVQELTRVVGQPWFWMAAIGCIVLRMVCILGVSDTYNLIFVRGERSASAVNLLYINRWESFLSYVPYSLCAFPFVGNFLQDYSLNRLDFMLPRSGCLNYAVAQVAVVFIGASFCMFIGDTVFVLVGCYGLGLPFGTSNIGNSSLLAGGHYFGFWLAMELMVCMQAVFYALLAMMVSFAVKDIQFVTVLPMVFLYITTYFFTCETAPVPRWLEPKGIYLHEWGMFAGDDIAQCLYAFFFTVLVAMAAAALLYFMLKRRVRG